jgi:hypothetical protein
MTYAIVTMHNQDYSDLAKYTFDQNKQPYCEQHGYGLFAKTNNFATGKEIYFDKIRYNLEVLENNPDLKWIWWLDCDAVITNFNKTIEEYCDDNYDFVVTLDRYALNNGSYFLKNSELGRQFLRDILALADTFADDKWPDQQPMISLIEHDDAYQAMTKFYPQREFNSYDYDFYHRDHGNTHDWDLFNKNGNWQPGDFVMHYPGIKYQTKIELAKNILQKVIR